MRARFRHVHFVGIGGIGMCGIAEVLLQLSYRVTGSDLQRSATTERLEKLGAVVHEGHSEHNVHDADVVVVSSAVKPDNPEVRRAHALKIPVIPRAEMLAELMRLKDGIAIAGAHGKTTMTAMTAAVLGEAGLDPTVVVGGRLRTLGATSRFGRGDFIVTEADESDRSFLLLSPVIAVVTNLDREHMESYRDLDDLVASFAAFLNKVPFWGLAVMCADDPRLMALAPSLRRRVVTYGLAKEANLSATSIWTRGHESGYRLERRGAAIGEVRLGVPGRHNVLNSLAAMAVGLELDVPFATIAAALARFDGADRRLEVKGEADGVLVVDDYGHHPTEIVATLAALREGYGRRVLCLFEPHRYSRVGALMTEFSRAFSDAAAVLVTDVYAAGEAPVPGLDGHAIAAALRAAGHPDAAFAGSVADAASLALERALPGDTVLTLGAGKVTHAGETLLAGLRERAAALSRLHAALESARLPFRADEPLARHTTLGVGGIVPALVLPRDTAELARAVQSLGDLAQPFRVLGAGSNLLAEDGELDFAVIATTALAAPAAFDGARVTAAAGLFMPRLVHQAAAAGLAGLEFGIGVPGSVGGALRMNAGAWGSEMSRVVESVLAVSLDDGGAEERPFAPRFAYRSAGVSEGTVVTRVTFRLEPGDAGTLRTTIERYIAERRRTQPVGAKSAGCAFKNPPGDSAGRLVDAAGLKGLARGGAQVSTLHGNFVVNRGGATAADVLALIAETRARVLERFGVTLEDEVVVWRRLSG